MTEQDQRRAERELADYVEATQESPTPGFTDWVMRSVAGEPLPRRGPLASLAALMTVPGPYRRAAQVMALALILVAGIGSAAVVGSLIDGEPSPSPSPTVEPSPPASPTPSVSPAPSPSPESTPALPSPSPTASPETPEATETPEPDETPEPTED